jgi:hypothetical protein
MKEKIKKPFYYINKFDDKSSWLAALAILFLIIQLGLIIYIGVSYTISLFGK